MTAIQKQFIKTHFFMQPYFTGWETIADALLDKGSCIVAGDGLIWTGGVGNFIKRTPTENAYRCTTLTFNELPFLTSRLFQDYKSIHLKDLQCKSDQLRDEYRNIDALGATN